jgi:hypothetical protein
MNIATFVMRLGGPKRNAATAQDRDGLRNEVRAKVEVPTSAAEDNSEPLARHESCNRFHAFAGTMRQIDGWKFGVPTTQRRVWRER